jgi:putative oxidoreductase
MSNKNISSIGLLLLRLVIGFGFVAHGYAKLSRGPANFGIILKGIGVPAPNLVAWSTSIIEVLGGFSIMIGAFVAPVSLPLFVIMLTAMLKVHLQYGFSSVRLKAITGSGAEFGPIGYEINLLYMVGLIALAFSAPTTLSLDHWLRNKKTSKNRLGQCDLRPENGPHPSVPAC